MFTAARASGPETRKAGSGMPTSHNFAHNSVVENSFVIAQAQRLTLVPRIIATHWLRAETMEAANG
jgi:hypothetical protein